MSDSFQIGELEQSFKTHFKNVSFTYEKVPLGLGVAHSFFIDVNTESILKDNWSQISNYFALNIQNQLISEFERWNIYLFFILDFEISRDLKYKIEKDTFSSRKIIVEEKTDIKKILERYILTLDLEITEREEGNDEFTPNPIFFENLNGIGNIKKVTNSLKAAYDNIIVELNKTNTNEA